MSTLVSSELIRIMVVALAFVTTAPVLAAPGFFKRAPDGGQTADDSWPEDFGHLLDSLVVLLMDATRGTSEVSIETVRDLYYDQGIPEGVDLVDGRARVARTYLFLQADPGYVEKDLKASFSNDLLQMYTELHGDPMDLLKGVK